ncbi:MAG TPA: GTP-binding protein, partial [Acidimicrobiales bacterium]
LVLALTGTDPDRLAEEKARGLTIDLGFAATRLPSGADVAFVDVPGHVRFIKNMLAGVGAVDACLFVVAATEGWKPQSEEHLRILELLGITRGVVALTKVSLVDEDGRLVAELDVRERVSHTFLAGAPIVPVDAVSGAGIAALVAALEALVAETPAAADHGRPRLWIDRAFAVKGAGTVVTGTLTGGRLSIDDDVVIEPSGRAARVRRMHSHHVELDHAGPGRRLAVNLAGVGHDATVRGDALVHPGQWHGATFVDASLSVLAALDHPVSRRGAYAAYIGSGEFPVRVRVLGRDGSIDPGGQGAVRLWLPPDVRLPLLPGDRYVLREAGRAETVGGGEILDVAPVLPASRAAPTRAVARVVAERAWVDAGLLERLTGARLAPSVGRWVVDPDALAASRSSLSDRVHAAGDALARQHGWTVTATTEWFGFGARISRDPRFDDRRQQLSLRGQDAAMPPVTRRSGRPGIRRVRD